MCERGAGIRGMGVNQRWVSALISATSRWKVQLPLGPAPALIYKWPSTLTVRFGMFQGMV